MQSLSLLSYGEIRVTDDNRFSVFDTIGVIGGKDNPRQCWNDLRTTYPEVVQKTDNLQFPGRGQRLTPVASVENIFYIIGLLPGAVGKAYREDAAREMCRKYGVSYESLVLAETEIVAKSPDVNIATLEIAGRIADGLLQVHKATVAKLDKIENLIQGTAVDIKGEIREGNHSISEDIKSVQLELQGINDFLKNADFASEKQGGRKKTQDQIVIYVPDKQQYQEWLDLAEKSGLSRSTFFYQILCKVLEVPTNG